MALLHLKGGQRDLGVKRLQAWSISMLAIKRRPIRSRRLWSFSKDRLRYGSDAGRLVQLVGVVMTLIGGLGVFIIGQALYRGDSSIALGLFALMIGCGQVALGTMCLWRNQVTLDRHRRIAVTRTGWFGIIRTITPIARVNAIASRPCQIPLFLNGCDREIILSADNHDAIVVGYASSDELAKEIEAEIRQFLL